MSKIAEAAEEFVKKMTDAENAPTVDESAEGTPDVEGELESCYENSLVQFPSTVTEGMFS